MARLLAAAADPERGGSAVLRLREHAITAATNVCLIDPGGNLDTLMLEQNGRVILRDSRRVQKEAYLHAVPCLALRPETEWVETVEAGWNRVVDADESAILEAIRERFRPAEHPSLFGDGHAAERLTRVLCEAAMT